MKAMHQLAVAALAAVGLTPGAHALTIDFDSPTPAGVSISYIANTGGALAALPTVLPWSLAYNPSAIPGGGYALGLSRVGALFTFDSLQSSVSMVGNDFGGDRDSDNERVYLTAFNALGDVIGTATAQAAWAEPNLQPISLSVSGIKSVAFTYSNDLGYYSVDNVVTTAVPEPETYALMLAGLAAVGAVARRRKSA